MSMAQRVAETEESDSGIRRIPSVCQSCVNTCGILIKVKNGTVGASRGAPPYCRHLMLFGSQKEAMVGHDTIKAAKAMADARQPGMKLNE